MNRQMLEFDAETHTYKLNGKVVPSVTQVIRAVLPERPVDEFYLGRGRAIHHGCRLLDEGRLDWSTVAPEIEPRIRAWQNFRVDLCGYRPCAIEQPLGSEALQFAGTLDRVFERQGADWTLMDLKSTISPQARVQLGGYSILWSAQWRGEGPRRPLKRAGAIELQDDGQYKALWLDQRELRLAEQVFVACLTVFNFMRAYKPGR